MENALCKNEKSVQYTGKICSVKLKNPLSKNGISAL
jgi:hypothetical protein